MTGERVKTHVLVMCLASTVALAQPAQPSLVAAPLEVEPNPSLNKHELGMRNAYFTMVELDSGAIVTSKRETETALTETKRQDFRDSDEALAQLAVKAKTLYALHAWTDLTTGKQLTLHGRVVRDDGKAMGAAVVQAPLKGEKPDKVMKKLAKELLEQLKLGALPAQKEVAVVPPPVETPPVEVKKDPPPDFVPPPPPPLVDPIVRDEDAGKRSAGKALFGTGVAVGVIGGVLAGVGAGVGYGVRRDANNQVLPAGAATATTARTLNTAGIITAGVGAAALAVGAILWGTSKPPPATLSVAPVAGGAYVQVGASF